MEYVQNFVKMLTSETIQEALDAELEQELGHSKYDYKNKTTDNSRNGYGTKQVQGSFGETEISVLRDRQGEFEPELVKKHQKGISQLEDKILFLYSEGVSTRDIQKTMDEMNTTLANILYTANATIVTNKRHPTPHHESNLRLIFIK